MVFCFWEEGYYFDLSELQHFLAISVSILYYEIIRFQFIVEKKGFYNCIFFDPEHAVFTEAWLKMPFHFLM